MANPYPLTMSITDENAFQSVTLFLVLEKMKSVFHLSPSWQCYGRKSQLYTVRTHACHIGILANFSIQTGSTQPSYQVIVSCVCTNPCWSWYGYPENLNRYPDSVHVSFRKSVQNFCLVGCPVPTPWHRHWDAKDYNCSPLPASYSQRQDHVAAASNLLSASS